MRDFTISLSTMGSQIIKRLAKSLPALHVRKTLASSVNFPPSLRVGDGERSRSHGSGVVPGSTDARSSGRLEEMAEQTVPQTLLT